MKPNIFSLIFILALGIGADALGRQLSQPELTNISSICMEEEIVIRD
ncbi:MAG: hypothetical protein VCD00_20630 [Candidatus Hydrogenedentota bacterium]